MDWIWNSSSGVLMVLGLGLVFFCCRNYFKRLASLGYAGVFLAGLIGSATIALPIPVFAVVGFVGSVLNPFFVGLTTAIGSTLGDLFGYYVGYTGGNNTTTFNQSEYEYIQMFMKNYGFLAVFLVAATPAIDLAGIVAGYNRIPILSFLIATFFGKLVKFLCYAYAGKNIATHYKKT
jgi:membrane protein YqaA with SNARE-associated domain